MAWPTAGNGCPTGPKARVDITLAILSESAADVDGRAIVFHESIERLCSSRPQIWGSPPCLNRLPDSLRAENIDAFRRGTISERDALDLYDLSVWLIDQLLG